MVVKNWEKCLLSAGPSWGAKGSLAWSTSAGESVPITPGCANQWGLCPRGIKGYGRPRHATPKGPASKITCSKLQTRAAARKVPGIYGKDVNWLIQGDDWRNGGWGKSLGGTETLAGTIVPLLSSPANQPTTCSQIPNLCSHLTLFTTTPPPSDSPRPCSSQISSSTWASSSSPSTGAACLSGYCRLTQRTTNHTQVMAASGLCCRLSQKFAIPTQVAAALGLHYKLSQMSTHPT